MTGASLRTTWSVLHSKARLKLINHSKTWLQITSTTGLTILQFLGFLEPQKCMTSIILVVKFVYSNLKCQKVQKNGKIQIWPFWILTKLFKSLQCWVYTLSLSKQQLNTSFIWSYQTLTKTFSTFKLALKSKHNLCTNLIKYPKYRKLFSFHNPPHQSRAREVLKPTFLVQFWEKIKKQQTRLITLKFFNWQKLFQEIKKIQKSLATMRRIIIL